MLTELERQREELKKHLGELKDQADLEALTGCLFFCFSVAAFLVIGSLWEKYFISDWVVFCLLGGVFVVNFFVWIATKPQRERRKQEEMRVIKELEQKYQEWKQKEEEKRQRRLEEWQAQEARRQEERAKAKQEKERREEEERLRKRQMWLDDRTQRLKMQVHLNRNFLDPAYQENLAKNQPEKVFQEQEQWFKEYRDVMHYADLVEYLRMNASEVIDFLEARVKTVKLAEQFAVTQRKLTPDERREKEIWWEEVQAKDELASIEALIMREVTKEIKLRQLKESILQNVPDEIKGVVNRIFDKLEQGGVDNVREREIL